MRCTSTDPSLSTSTKSTGWKTACQSRDQHLRPLQEQSRRFDPLLEIRVALTRSHGTFLQIRERVQPCWDCGCQQKDWTTIHMKSHHYYNHWSTGRTYWARRTSLAPPRHPGLCGLGFKSSRPRTVIANSLTGMATYMLLQEAADNRRSI